MNLQASNVFIDQLFRREIVPAHKHRQQNAPIKRLLLCLRSEAPTARLFTCLFKPGFFFVDLLGFIHHIKVVAIAIILLPTHCMQSNERTTASLMQLPWQVLALACVFVFFPFYWRDFYPMPGTVRDFFQDWSSARSYLDGGSIYPSLPVMAEKYLNIRFDPRTMHLGQYSTHPPPSVLLFIPWAYLSYAHAFLLWNLMGLFLLMVSLAWILQELQVEWSQALAWLGVAVVVAASPLQSQIYHAQMNLLLLFLITASWRADRHGHAGWAGAWLGLAAAIKLMPAFLFLIFLVRGSWKALFVGGIVWAACLLAAVGCFGWEAFSFYSQHLMPHLQQYRSAWLNQSLHGYFSRLLDVGQQTPNVIPWMTVPWLAKGLTWLSAGGVTFWSGWLTWSNRKQRRHDSSWGATLTAMLLASPFTWDHYLLLLVLPLILLARSYTAGPARWSWLYGVVLGLLWLHPAAAWSLTIPGGFDRGVATPWRSMTVISYKCYAMLILLALQWRLEHQRLVSALHEREK